jgi:AcrR family transcriptional regulator
VTTIESSRGRKPRAAPVTDRGETTRGAIINAAIDEIVEVGYAHARIPEISRRAGVGYGTFYLYFHNKLDLARQMMEEAWHDVRRGALLQDSVVPWPERIRAGVEHTVDAHGRHAQTFRALWGAAGIDPELGATRERLLNEDVAILTATIKAEIPNGHMPSGEAALVSLAVNAMCDEVCRRWVLANCVPPRDDLVATLTRACNLLLLDGEDSSR